MKALIYKDLVSLKRTVLLSLVILAVVCFNAVQQGAVLLLPMIFVLMPVILLGIIFGSDTQSKVDVYIIPGPIKRTTVVLSRYAFIWFMALIGTLFTMLLKALTSGGILAEIPWHFIIATMPLLTTLIAAIQLPLMYKFGAEKGRLVFVVLYFIIFALFSYIGSNKGFISELVNKLENLNLGVVSLLLVGVTLLLNAVSFTLSEAIYSKKEF
ncbi:MAG: ABC-2 transporter permease [Bacillota bacterium]|nr:ABC-2 transporter permease [Bacillota bacterium]